MIDPAEAIGLTRTGPLTVVESDQVLSYVEAIGGDPHEMQITGIAPPIYANVVSTPVQAELLLGVLSERRLLASVHISQAMTFLCPLTIGSVVRPRAELVEVRSSRFGCVLTLKVDLVLEDGEPISSGHHSVFVRGGPKARSAGRVQPFRPISRDAVPCHAWSRRIHVAPDQSVRYSNASGDHLPIHTDASVARAAGFEGLVLHGMCTLAMCAETIVSEAVDKDSTRLTSIRATFVRPVLCGHPLDVTVSLMSSGALTLEASQRGRSVLRSAGAELKALE